MSILTLEAVRSRAHTCLRCRSHFGIVYPAERQSQADILQVRQAGSVVQTIVRLRELTGGDLRDAKGTAMHIAPTAGECHWCRKPIPQAEFSDCPHCASLNIHPDT